MLMHCAKQETSFLFSELFIKQIMQLKYQNEILSKIVTKCGRNNYLLDISDKFRWEVVVTFCLFTRYNFLIDHLYFIGILNEVACPRVTKEKVYGQIPLVYM